MLVAVHTPAQLQAARAGDPQALQQVLAHSRQDLRRFAEAPCALHLFEDAVQEVIIHLARRRGGLRRLARRVSGLFRVIRRVCQHVRRGWRTISGGASDDAILPVAHPEPLAWRVEISRTLAELPAHYREVLLVRDVEGLGIQAIAERLQLTPSEARSRLQRARMLARARLEPSR